MLRNRKIIIDFHQKFGDEQGARILDYLKKRYPLVTGGVQTKNGVDVNKLLVMEGEANVVKHIFFMLGRDPNVEEQSKAINTIPNVGE